MRTLVKCFKGNEDNAIKFWEAMNQLSKDCDKTDLVNQLVRAGQISHDCKHSPLFTLLKNNGLYGKSLSNWYHRILQFLSGKSNDSPIKVQFWYNLSAQSTQTAIQSTICTIFLVTLTTHRNFAPHSRNQNSCLRCNFLQALIGLRLEAFSPLDSPSKLGSPLGSSLLDRLEHNI